MEDSSGIIGYGVAYMHDRSGGVGLSPPAYRSIPSTQEQYIISVPKYQFRDGDVVVIWFTVSDTAGNRDDVQLTVGLDRSAPEITAEEFNTETLDEFTST